MFDNQQHAQHRGSAQSLRGRRPRLLSGIARAPSQPTAHPGPLEAGLGTHGCGHPLLIEPGVEIPLLPPCLGHSPICFTYLCSSFPNRFGEESGRGSRPPYKNPPFATAGEGVLCKKSCFTPRLWSAANPGLFWERSCCSELLPRAAHTLAERREKNPFPQPAPATASCADRRSRLPPDPV